VSNKAEGAVVGIRELQEPDNVVEPKVTANLASVSTSTVMPNADAGQKEPSTSQQNGTASNTEKTSSATTTVQSEGMSSTFKSAV